MKKILWNQLQYFVFILIVFSVTVSVFIYTGVSMNMNLDASIMSNMVGLASRQTFIFPFFGFQIRLWGLQTVNHTNFCRLMTAKKPIGIVPGGFEQATLTTPKQIRIFIKERKGFIKYSLKYGYTIYPVLCYNEHKAFWTFDGLKNLRLALNRFKIPSVIFGMGFLGIFLPLNLDIVNIVGRGIKRNPKNEGKEITNEQLNEVHAEYIKQLQRMHEKYRNRYGETPLVIY